MCRSQSERVTTGSDSTTSNNVVLVDMRPADDAEFGLDEAMVRALEEVSHNVSCWYRATLVV